MQLNASSFLLLKKLSAKNRAQRSADAEVSQRGSSVDSTPKLKSHTERFQDWLSPKPGAILKFSGEREIFRRGLVLVTDSRLAYIDPFDRMLKTYMFEHMISVHKQFYKPTVFNRRLCKGLLILCIVVFFLTLIINLLNGNSRGFIAIYLLVCASILIVFKVWNDMKPRYVLHWRMRDHTYGEISQEPFFRERLLGDNKREEFMNELASAMNQALSARAWHQAAGQTGLDDETVTANTDRNRTAAEIEASGADKKPVKKMQLVTENYQ